MKRFASEHSLGLVSFGLFLLVWIGGQSVAGHRTYNEEQRDHGGSEISYGTYLTTAHFGEATFENWESEFLQMGGYVLLTVFLRHKGSAESNPLEGEDASEEDPEGHEGDADAPWPVRRGGWALRVYKHSLSLAFIVLFLITFALHALTGAREYSNDQLVHGGKPVSALQYLFRSQFWFESMQNWQSEFLAVAAIVVLTVYLRQKDSPESKAVHAPNSQTGTG
jgi:hypothetical protein